MDYSCSCCSCAVVGPSASSSETESYKQNPVALFVCQLTQRLCRAPKLANSETLFFACSLSTLSSEVDGLAPSESSLSSLCVLHFSFLFRWQRFQRISHRWCFLTQILDFCRQSPSYLSQSQRVQCCHSHHHLTPWPPDKLLLHCWLPARLPVGITPTLVLESFPSPLPPGQPPKLSLCSVLHLGQLSVLLWFALNPLPDHSLCCPCSNPQKMSITYKDRDTTGN